MKIFLFFLLLSCTTIAQNWDWAKKISGPQASWPSQMICDSLGNTYLAFYYYSGVYNPIARICNPCCVLSELPTRGLQIRANVFGPEDKFSVTNI